MRTAEIFLLIALAYAFGYFVTALYLQVAL